MYRCKKTGVFERSFINRYSPAQAGPDERPVKLSFTSSRGARCLYDTCMHVSTTRYLIIYMVMHMEKE